MSSKKLHRKNQESEKTLAKSCKLKKGDTVMVIAGGSDKKRDNKGKTGRILKFAGKKNDRAVVEGINFFTKHKRQTSPESPAAKVQVEGSIHISNLLYYVEKIKKPVRLKYSFLDDGKKVRGYTDPETKKFVQV